MSESLYESAPNLEKREWLALAAIAALCGVAFFFLLGGVPLLGKDEPRYAQVAREMYQTGDWITPRLAGHAWFEKPALPYWLMAAAYAVMGVGEFAARIGAAAAATVGVFLVYGAARRAGGPSQAAVSAVMLATSPLWFAFARGAGFDMPLAVTITGALAAVYVYDTTDSARGRIRWAALAGVWAGGSMLAKGLVGPLLLVLIVAPYLLVAGSWRRVRYTHLAVALGAAAAVAAVWYVPVTARNGWPFIQEFFINHHFQRYLTNKYHHPQPFYFYPLVVLAGLLPWTPVVLARIGELWSALRRRGADGPDRLLLLAALWVVMPVLFFSASTSKLPGYILPVFPGLALLAGWAAVRIDVSGRGRWSLCAIALVVAGLGIGMAAYAGRALGAPAWESALVAGLALIAACAVATFAVRRRATPAIWSGAAGMACLVVLIAVFLFPELAQRESLADLSRTANASLLPGEQVLLFGVVEYTPVFYTNGRMAVDPTGEVLVSDGFAQVATALAAAPSSSVLCVTDERRAADLAAHNAWQITRIASSRDRVLLRIATSSRLGAPGDRALPAPSSSAAE